MSEEPQPETPVPVLESATPAPSSSSVISDEVWESAAGEWINSHLRSSPLAGATDAWNHVMGAIPHFRSILEAALKR